MKMTDADFQVLEVQAQENGERLSQKVGAGIRHRLPKRLGEGGDLVFSLRNSLTVSIRRGKLHQPIQHFRQHGDCFPLVSTFYLSGHRRVQTLDASDIDSDYQETAGCHYLYHLPNHLEVEKWPVNQLIHGVMISAKTDYFQSFNQQFEALPQPLDRLLQGNSKPRFHQPLGQMTPQIQRLVQNILHCPYSDLMQQMYLEGKALELLAAQFALWTDQPPGAVSVTLSKDEVDRVHQAQAVLLDRAKQPPSLGELARLVGLSDRKLNQGFRHLFGTTVFGYLKAYRLQQAQALLRDDRLTIAAVAMAVGYQNPEAFSTAFRRKFAVSPKTYQLSFRG